MNNFKPKTDIKAVPFFEDVTSVGGWEGHRTRQTIEKLKSEIATNLSLVGCLFTGCMSGSYGDRHGFQIHFAVASKTGVASPSRMDICCLPTRGQGNLAMEGTQKMALYMTAQAIKGTYFLSVLSPSYVPFMSLMLNSKDETLGELWMAQGSLTPLLPPPDTDFVEGEVSE